MERGRRFCKNVLLIVNEIGESNEAPHIQIRKIMLDTVKSVTTNFGPKFAHSSNVLINTERL